ncbi:putative exosome complex exonuclease rrp6 [Erysiphe neolycopersici]|uniref:Putative exosome complex exonuclease rrp6 n=1 Tax=Erysiphe neolycopersici TaxID=212602 RepID=A0A420HQ43_9PEZI|nr:putative exosome complex exonuclease rrp6 [Erysiphe neolycopersici]
MEGRNESAKQQISIVIPKLDEIPQLNGHENYHAWALAMTNVWRDMKMYQVVVKGERPNRETSKKDIKLYKSLCREAIHILYNDRRIIQDEIVQLSKNLDLNDPHIIWRFLEAKYEMGVRCNNPFINLIFQVSTVLKGLSNFYNSTSLQSLSTLIEKFEIEWLLLQKLTEDYSTESPYQKNLFHFLQDDEAKCQALLGFLGDLFKEVCIDIREENLSFAQVKKRLLTLESGITQNHKVSHTSTHEYNLAPNSIESVSKSTHHQETLTRKLQNIQQTSINSILESIDAEINLKTNSQLKILNHQVEVNSCPQNSIQPKSIKKEITALQTSLGKSPQNLQITDDDERFDYSKAPSLLRGTKREGIWEQSGKKKPFDPYLKNMEVKNGARRPPIARAGKSHTFRQ